MAEINYNFDLYEIPSDAVLQNRKIFYGLQRQAGEQTKTWLNRVEKRIYRCEFPEFIAYLLIDKFIGELDSTERRFIRDTAGTWTLGQMCEYLNSQIVDPGVNSVHRNAAAANNMVNGSINRCQQIPTSSLSSSSAIKMEYESVSQFEKDLKLFDILMCDIISG